MAFVSGTMFFSVDNSSAESKAVDIIAKVRSVLAITTNATNGELLLDIMPTPSGTLVKNDLTVSVSTNNSTGYTLNMNSKTTNTSLVHEAATGTPPAPNIPSTNNAYNGPAALGANTWGWNLGAAASTSAFKKIPPSDDSQTIKTTDAPSNTPSLDSDTLVTFGINVVDTITTGNYINTIVFTATSNFVPPPIVTVPEGSYPDNIANDNPAVLDVYPTTGWKGDTVVITGDNIFVNVHNVTIGGTDCDGYNVMSTSVIACRLPNKPHGSAHNVEVMVGPTAPGTDVILAATYKHMKITYFDPSQTTIVFADTTNFSGSTFKYFPGTNPSTTFGSSDCALLTTDNSSDVDIPNSLVFVRDTRNNQVYKVKKMIDNKCWMIDNLKYQGKTDRDGNVIQNYDGVDGGGIPNGTAGSVGMVFRNGRGPNIPSIGIDTFNTIDGNGPPFTDVNGNKAFWNNAMGNSGCYDGVASGLMAANTLTYCGYHYNWYAATGGTGTYSSNGMDTNGNQATGSICPANFRLFSGFSGVGGPTTPGTTFTVADSPVLNMSMRYGVLSTGDITDDVNTRIGWQPDGAWSSTISGSWYRGFANVGSQSYFWSSTVETNDNARTIAIAPGLISTSGGAGKVQGRNVRCVME